MNDMNEKGTYCGVKQGTFTYQILIFDHFENQLSQHAVGLCHCRPISETSIYVLKYFVTAEIVDEKHNQLEGITVPN